jgi:hypothetical protein
MCLDIVYIQVHSKNHESREAETSRCIAKNHESREAETSSNLRWSKYIIARSVVP